MTRLSHQDRKARYWGLPVPPGLKHGPATYAKGVYGCDCTLCLPSGRRNRPRGQRVRATDRNREYRHRMAGQPVPAHIEHGSYTAWRVYRCQCPLDVAARKEARRARDQAWRKRARGHWHTEERDGVLVDVVHWPPRELDEPWLCPTCEEFKVMPDE